VLLRSLSCRHVHVQPRPLYGVDMSRQAESPVLQTHPGAAHAPVLLTCPGAANAYVYTEYSTVFTSRCTQGPMVYTVCANNFNSVNILNHGRNDQLNNFFPLPKSPSQKGFISVNTKGHKSHAWAPLKRRCVTFK